MWIKTEFIFTGMAPFNFVRACGLFAEQAVLAASEQAASNIWAKGS
jgi:hypothetical protein